jgi:hypothetical protein
MGSNLQNCFCQTKVVARVVAPSFFFFVLCDSSALFSLLCSKEVNAKILLLRRRCFLMALQACWGFGAC